MLVERGAMRGGDELAPTSSATTVRNGDQVSVTDGPFAEAAEVFGGYYVIEVDDLDAAIEIANRTPSSRPPGPGRSRAFRPTRPVGC